MPLPLFYLSVSRGFSSSAVARKTLQKTLKNALAAPIVSRGATDAFKDGQHAEFVAAAATSSSIPRLQGLPEVIVTGRANVGKSTLFNAVANRKDLFHVGKTPGKTKMLNFFRIGANPGNLVLVDAPGYGARGRREWGALFNAYVKHRSELRCIYILFNAKHGISKVDEAMLASLEEQCQKSRELYEQADHSKTRSQPLMLQAIITKADLLPRGSNISKMREQITTFAPHCLDPIVTSANMRPPFGIAEVRASILRACGLA